MSVRTLLLATSAALSHIVSMPLRNPEDNLMEAMRCFTGLRCASIESCPFFGSYYPIMNSTRCSEFLTMHKLDKAPEPCVVNEEVSLIRGELNTELPHEPSISFLDPLSPLSKDSWAAAPLVTITTPLAPHSSTRQKLCYTQTHTQAISEPLSIQKRWVRHMPTGYNAQWQVFTHRWLLALGGF